MLYVMGEESEKIFEILKFGKITVGEGEGAIEVDEDDKDFETVVSKFDSYFLVKRNIIYERTKFQERRQEESETIEEFYRSLRTLVAHCEYKDTEDQVRDRFVIGLNDYKLKEKLQLIHDLSLDKALEIARQHEQIKLQMKQQGGSASSDEATRGRDKKKMEMDQETEVPILTEVGMEVSHIINITETPVNVDGVVMNMDKRDSVQQKIKHAENVT